MMNLVQLVGLEDERVLSRDRCDIAQIRPALIMEGERQDFQSFPSTTIMDFVRSYDILLVFYLISTVWRAEWSWWDPQPTGCWVLKSCTHPLASDSIRTPVPFQQVILECDVPIRSCMMSI